MVRVKKRYFVIQMELARDIAKKNFKRALASQKELQLSDAVLASAIKELVQELHGDHGSASVSQGLRAIYCNSATRLVLLQVRHGPHRIVGSVLPFLTKIKDEKIVPRLLYTGATVRNCYRFMEKHQKKELVLALKELQKDSKLEKEKTLLEEKMLNLRQLNN